MPGILPPDLGISANPVLQVDPNAGVFHAVGPGGILGSMKIPETTPAGNPMPKLLQPETFMAEQPLAGAYGHGSNAYHLGQSEKANPFEDRLGVEWLRGYKSSRKQDRFNATIRQRQTETE